ncbi:transposase [Thiomicrospira aerophila AL3]|uniref:Transposase n=1 Tax=Thiomicrospira aerophila AL3 TaxID=717772 RepID=W0DYP0_9GAMM|nr:heteromeric transposase endonuclease subunit TnsA [Thiomicrospira aerophila]AHF01976.1 transposase [Thiomicrospira aerophila AL3]
MKFSHKNRKIGYTYGSLSGAYSFRGEKSLSFESKIERDFLTLLEFDDSVIEVTEQPFTIEYENHNGRPTTYTPDFLIEFKSPLTSSSYSAYRKSLLVEVKPHDILKKKFLDLKPKFQIGMRFAKANDMVFKIFSDSKIRTPKLKNIQMIARYKRYKYCLNEESRIREHLQNVGHTRLDHLLCFLYVTEEQRSIALGQIWQLVWNKQIGCDLTLPLNLQTVVWLKIDETYEEGVFNDRF